MTRWGGDAVGGHSWRTCMFGSRVYPLPARTSRRLGGSPVGGHGDVFSGGSSWTVTRPLLDFVVDLFALSCSLVMRRRQL